MVPATSAGGREGDLQIWASGSGIGEEVGLLNSALRQMKSVLADVERKEIQNVQLVRSLKEAHHAASQAEDLRGELEYYRIQEKVEREEHDCMDGLIDEQDMVLQELTYLFQAEEDTTESSTFCTEDSSPASPIVVPAGNISPGHLLAISSEINDHIESCHNMIKDLPEALEIEEWNDLIRIEMKKQSTGTDPRETSSCPTEPKVYGRDQEQDLIINKLTSEKSAGENLSVLAIVGYGGVGKTTLANAVFNDSRVSKHFEERLWVYVSVYFDQAKIMHKLLESLIGDKHEKLTSLKELQDNLKYALKSKRVLLVLDDMWEDTQEERWRDLLTPLLSNDVQGNRVLVTTRKPSVAKFTRATDHINLDGLKPDDFWKLFKEWVFGNENFTGERILQEVGKKIVVQLKGNPLAAKSVGTVLRNKLDVDFWTTVLTHNEWKHGEDDYDIMPALMISYKYLPDDLKPCFSYCAVFPKYHRYDKECLVNMWIALGLICSTDMHKRLEDIGSEFFNDLVEWGFLQKEFEFGSLLIMHDLIHDLAQKVSSHENFTIVDNESGEAPQLIRHVSIVTEWQYMTQTDGSVGPNEDFLQGFSSFFGELQQKKLSTVMLFGPHDLDFAHTFCQELTEVKSIRVLKLEMAVFDLDSLIGNISEFVNLRYLELGCIYKGPRLELPEFICKLYHLQVLDIKKNWGSSTVIPRGMNKLVNLRHFIAIEELVAKVPGIGKMVSLQELKAFGVRRVGEFSISQLKRLNHLRGSISIYNLGHVGSQQEAIEASICDKVHLTTLQLSWYPVSGQRAGFSSELPILEDLRPHAGLVNLRIEACRNSVPSWLSTNVHLTSLRSLHLNNCSRWRTIPKPHQLPLLRELHLINMVCLLKIEIGCLEILELRNLQRLTQCRFVDKEQLAVNLRVLEVEYCDRLGEFPEELFISNDLQSECQFTRLRRLQAYKNEKSFDHTNICHLLLIDSLTDIHLSLHSNLGEFRLQQVGLPNRLCMKMNGSRDALRIEGRLFPFGKLRSLVELEISNYPLLTSLPWEGFQQLASLKKLKMIRCSKLFLGSVELSLPPSVEELEFSFCNITGTQVSQFLVNLKSLKNLKLINCEEVTSLPVELFTDEQNQLAEGSWLIPPNCVTTLESLHISFGIEGPTMHFSSKKGLGRFVSLKKVVIENCPILLSTMVSGGTSDIHRSSLIKLHVQGIKDSFLQLSEISSLVELLISNCPALTCVNLDFCTSLQELQIVGCELLSSLEGLQLCKALSKLSIQGCTVLCSLNVSLNTLTELSIERNPNLEDLNLHSCTALQKLCIENCTKMASCEGLKSLVGLEDLKVVNSPGFTMSWLSAAAEGCSQHNYFPQTLQVLDTDDIGFLCMPICSQLSSLKTLIVHGNLESPLGHLKVLTDDHEKALVRLNSLRHLEFDKFEHLKSLPAEFQSLTSLKRLTLDKCGRISSLPVGGLPASLKDMDVNHCSHQLNASCRKMRRFRKIHVRIDGTDVE